MLTDVGSPSGVQVLGLVVLPSQGRHHHSQELLESGLNVCCEAISQLGGDFDGQAVSQQLCRGKKETLDEFHMCYSVYFHVR